MGGGDVIVQALEQGLVDKLRLHLAPFVLGGGTPLFKQRCSPVSKRRAPHLRTRIDPDIGATTLRERQGKEMYFLSLP